MAGNNTSLWCDNISMSQSLERLKCEKNGLPPPKGFSSGN